MIFNSEKLSNLIRANLSLSERLMGILQFIEFLILFQWLLHQFVLGTLLDNNTFLRFNKLASVQEETALGCFLAKSCLSQRFDRILKSKIFRGLAYSTLALVNNLKNLWGNNVRLTPTN